MKEEKDVWEEIHAEMDGWMVFEEGMASRKEVEE